jgi:hypothetical protein
LSSSAGFAVSLGGAGFCASKTLLHPLQRTFFPSKSGGTAITFLHSGQVILIGSVAAIFLPQSLVLQSYIALK